MKKQTAVEEHAKEFYPDENQLMERIAFKRGYTECKENSYSEEEVKEIIRLSCEEGMLIQRTINDKVKIPYSRIKDFTIKTLEQFKKK